MLASGLGVGVIKKHVQQLASYNRWANARRPYAAAFNLPDKLYRKPTGVFSEAFMGH